MRFLSVTVVAGSLLLGAGLPAALAVTPFKVTSIFSPMQLRAPGLPFDSRANANRLANAALARAKAEHKFAFIVLGANWSRQSRKLAAFLALPEVQKFVTAHYIVAFIDVGHLDRNLQIPARWGIVDRLSGLPTVIIANPRDHSLVNRGRIADLASLDRMDAQQIANWMVWWAK